MSVTRNFLNLLFDPGESTCFAEQATGVAVKRYPGPRDQFFCINPLNAYMDLRPTEIWHDAAKPRRADHNVTVFRNLLVELDSVPLQEQIEYVKALVPVSAITFSGNKSYHFIVSLTTPLPSIEAYRDAARRLLTLVDKADKSCKNPSRLSRLPGIVRPDTQRLQSLVELGARVETAQFLAGLPTLAPIKLAEVSHTGFTTLDVHRARRYPDEFIAKKSFSGRNAFFFWLGQRLLEANMAYDAREGFVLATYGNLQHNENFSQQEALMAARLRGKRV